MRFSPRPATPVFFAGARSVQRLACFGRPLRHAGDTHCLRRGGAVAEAKDDGSPRGMPEDRMRTGPDPFKTLQVLPARNDFLLAIPASLPLGNCAAFAGSGCIMLLGTIESPKMIITLACSLEPLGRRLSIGRNLSQFDLRICDITLPIDSPDSLLFRIAFMSDSGENGLDRIH